MFCFMQQKRETNNFSNMYFVGENALWVSVNCLKTGTCPDMNLIILIREDQHNQSRNSQPNTQERQQSVSTHLNLNVNKPPFQSLYLWERYGSDPPTSKLSRAGGSCEEPRRRSPVINRSSPDIHSHHAE